MHKTACPFDRAQSVWTQHHLKMCSSVGHVTIKLTVGTVEPAASRTVVRASASTAADGHHISVIANNRETGFIGTPFCYQSAPCRGIAGNAGHHGMVTAPRCRRQRAVINFHDTPSTSHRKSRQRLCEPACIPYGRKCGSATPGDADRRSEQLVGFQLLARPELHTSNGT